MVPGESADQDKPLDVLIAFMQVCLQPSQLGGLEENSSLHSQGRTPNRGKQFDHLEQKHGNHDRTSEAAAESRSLP